MRPHRHLETCSYALKVPSLDWIRFEMSSGMTIHYLTVHKSHSVCMHAGRSMMNMETTWTTSSASQWPQASNHLLALDSMSLMNVNENTQTEQHLNSKVNGISLALDSTSASVKIY